MVDGRRKKGKKSKGAKKRLVVVLYAYDSEPLGICVGIPLNKRGDVFLLYEAGRFCACVKNLSGVARKEAPPSFLYYIREQFAYARDLQQIRELLGKDNGCEKVQPRHALEKLFEL